MYRLPLLIAAAAVAGIAPAQVAPSPDSATMGDKSATPPPSRPKPTDAVVPLDSGAPSDVHTTAPPVTSKAPPATAADAAAPDAKAKGRARPSSTAKTPPRA